jgi:hypothetical protein
MKKPIEEIISVLLRSLLIISIFLVSVTVYSARTWAFGSDWQQVAESRDLKYYVDTKSISEQIGSCSFHRCFPWHRNCGCDDTPTRFIRAWIKKISKAPQQYQAIEELDYQEYDCTEGRRRLLHLTKFYPDGVNESVNLSILVKWQKIPRDEIAHFLYSYLCKER